MASVSISFTAAQAEDSNLENITVAASAPGAGEIELRVDTTKFVNLKQIILALEKMERFAGDQLYGPTNFKVL